MSVNVGDLHADRKKSCSHECYLVISAKVLWCSQRKFTGLQLRDFTCRVKMSDCYLVPATCPVTGLAPGHDDLTDEDDAKSLHIPRAEPPNALHPPIPPELESVPVPTVPRLLTRDVEPPILLEAPDTPLRHSTRQRCLTPHLSDYVIDL